MIRRELTLTEVGKRFGNQEILRNVNLSISGGTVMGLKGRNGSGKSVLLKCMCGLMAPSEGTITYNGKAVSSDTISDFNFGVSIEKPELINDLSGLANIRFLASFRKVVSNAQIQAWFERFGLSSARNKKAGDYSLGMKQKLMLIQAFMEDPDVILLDEVTNSLDLQSREILFDVIREERAKGKVILLVDHDLEELKEISDSIITIEKGEIRTWDFRK